MKSLLGVKYNAFVITSTVAAGVQPTIYFDDITMVCSYSFNLIIAYIYT